MLAFSVLLALAFFAQAPQQIEANLIKSFKRIDFWFEKTRDTTFDIVGANDSLGKANVDFANKLKHYIEKFPSTITYPFASLKKSGLDIITSSDGLLRIYAWDTWTGGTMHNFENVLQYKTGVNTAAIIDTTKNENDYVYSYDDLYTMKANDRTYYLATYLGVYSTKDSGRGIRIFAVENGKLNNDVKLIRTGSGLHSHLYYDYNFFSVVDIPYEKRPTIIFDKATNTISLPLVDGNHNVTNKRILYKFNGQYFERIRN